MPVVDDFTALLQEQGVSWAGNGETGRSVFITYSFENKAPSYVADYDGRAFAQTFRPLSEDNKASARTALSQWEDVRGIVFLEVPAGQGDIRFGLYDFKQHDFFTQAAAAAYYPSTQVSADYTDRSEIGGDVYIDWRYAYDLGLYQHELGHALGFKHPFEGDPQLVGNLDNKTYTALSYNGPSQPDIGPLDKDAVRHLYGKTDGAHLKSWDWNAATLTLTQVDGNDGDLLLGVGVSDVIHGAGGRDTIAGFSGRDALYGDGAKDNLFGAEDSDVLHGGSGSDRLDGDAGKDSLYGDAGDDFGYGGGGKDLLFGGLDDDSLFGSAGSDFLRGSSGLDLLVGGSGNDSAYGGGGGDLIEGGDGNDFLKGVKGVDLLFGDNDADVLDGGQGDDWLEGGKSGDQIYGDRGDDFIRGDGGGDEILGLAGKDTLEGGSGKDTVNGGDGSDHLNGGAQDDWLVDGRGKDRLTGGEDADVFQIGTDGNEDIVEDFEAGQDLIALSGLTFADLALLDVAPGEVRIEHAGEALTVRDGGQGQLSASQLSAGDFLFLV